MASPIQTAAVLFLVVAGVFGADVDLGGTCTPSTDTCVHTSLDLTCDNVFLKCVIKDGQTCTGAGHRDLCVFGATCDTGTSQCKCTSGVYTATNGLCVNSDSPPLYGGVCSSSTTCDATTSNLECRTAAPEVCVCNSDYKLNPATGKCVAVTAAKIGHTCTVGTTGTCDTGSTCGGSPAVCSCDAGKSGILDGTCTDIATEKNGAACGTCGSNAACTGGFCVCNSGYTAVVGGDCVPSAGKVGGGCSGTSGQQGSCADSFALCTTTGQGKTCKIPASKVGHECTASTATAECGDATTTHLECSTTSLVCVCSAGYTGATGGDCSAIPASKVGHICTASTAAADCGDPAATHLGCSTTAPIVCVCSAGYEGVAGGDCTEIPPSKVGHTCTAGSATTDCGVATTTHLECSATAPTVCVCSTGYSGPTAGDCAIAALKVGHTCTAGTATTDCGNATTTHLECSATAPTVCVCSTGYSGPIAGDCAVDNGASSVVVSATTVLLAATLGLLISV